MKSLKTKLILKFFLLAGIIAIGLVVLLKTKLLNIGAMESLLSPGPLALSHEKYETDCASCHRAFDKKAQKGLCLDCHKEVKEDLLNRRGVHGGIASAKDTDCRSCHTEHKGRSFDIRHLDKKSFNHNLTGFALVGAHAGISSNCEACHLQGKIYRDASAQCSSCHANNDIHKGKNGMKCESCHTQANWKQIIFDHNKDTHFRILGKHSGLKCESCHKDDSGRMDIDPSCYSCHAKNDAHKAQEGKDCESCHTQNSWKEVINFDHDFTGFPLIGLHAVATCQDCHLSAAFKDAEKDCSACHLKEDYHKGILGKDCAKCHNPNGWKLWVFDHNTHTAFKLEGAHAGLECQACHKKPIGKDSRLSGRCFSCHENDDRHDGRFGQQCDQCHTAESFKKISFPN